MQTRGYIFFLEQSTAFHFESPVTLYTSGHGNHMLVLFIFFWGKKGDTVALR